MTQEPYGLRDRPAQRPLRVPAEWGRQLHAAEHSCRVEAHQVRKGGEAPAPGGKDSSPGLLQEAE